MKAEIPTQEPERLQEARSQKRQRFSEQKDESRSLLQGGGNEQTAPTNEVEQKIMPVKSEKMAGRNDKVTVQYPDGRVLKDVKYKKVEDDIRVVAVS